MRLIMMLSGSLLMIVGLLSMVTPIPGGTLIIAIGAGLILCSSPTAIRCAKKWRTDYRRFNNVVTWIENRIGERLSKALRQTRPDEVVEAVVMKNVP